MKVTPPIVKSEGSGPGHSSNPSKMKFPAALSKKRARKLAQRFQYSKLDLYVAKLSNEDFVKMWTWSRDPPDLMVKTFHLLPKQIRKDIKRIEEEAENYFQLLTIDLATLNETNASDNGEDSKDGPDFQT